MSTKSLTVYGLGQFRTQTLRECPPGLWDQLCDTPESAAEHWRANIGRADNHFHNPDVEAFWVLALNTRRRVLGCYMVSTGTLDTILVHPREVFRSAIVANAAALVLMHNHPSGDPTPSEADIKVTRDLIRAGQLLKIDILDHVIMGHPRDGFPKDFSSLRELGYFYS